ncbi:hypothetical protein U6X02_12480, partial [Cutibacterium acnes]
PPVRGRFVYRGTEDRPAALSSIAVRFVVYRGTSPALSTAGKPASTRGFYPTGIRNRGILLSA